MTSPKRKAKMYPTAPKADKPRVIADGAFPATPPRPVGEVERADIQDCSFADVAAYCDHIGFTDAGVLRNLLGAAISYERGEHVSVLLNATRLVREHLKLPGRGLAVAPGAIIFREPSADPAHDL